MSPFPSAADATAIMNGIIAAQATAAANGDSSGLRSRAKIQHHRSDRRPEAPPIVGEED